MSNLLQTALMNITTRALTAQDWEAFRQIRLRALHKHPRVYLGFLKEAAARTGREWQEMLDGQGKCIFGLFDSDKIFGLAAVFTSRKIPMVNRVFWR